MENLTSKLLGISRETGILLMVAAVIITIILMILSDGWHSSRSFFDNLSEIYIHRNKGVKIYFGYSLPLTGIAFLAGLNGFLKGKSVKVNETTPPRNKI
ncbi:MAG: hypothetical protein RPS47_12905 [Colwellia sp.]